MRFYIVTDKDNFIRQSGTILEGSEDFIFERIASKDQTVHFDVEVPNSFNKLKYENAQVVDTGLPIFEKSVSQKRAAEYPAIGDQLEALWEYVSSQPGEKPEKVQQVLSGIAEVKQRFPK
jgi:hypothetical protein